MFAGPKPGILTGSETFRPGNPVKLPTPCEAQPVADNRSGRPPGEPTGPCNFIMHSPDCGEP